MTCQKNVKSHVFLKSEKNVKYVFSNSDSYQLNADKSATVRQLKPFFQILVFILLSLYVPSDIGVASNGALGHVLSTHNCLLFQITSAPHKVWHSTPSGCLSSNKPEEYCAYSGTSAPQLLSLLIA